MLSVAKSRTPETRPGNGGQKEGKLLRPADIPVGEVPTDLSFFERGGFRTGSQTGMS